MLNEISCWVWDWSAIGAVGAWAGGIATAGTLGWAMYSANDAWKRERARRQVKTNVLQVLITPEVARTFAVVNSILKQQEIEVLDSPERVQYAIDNLRLTYLPQLLNATGDVDEGLALAAAQVQVLVETLLSGLARWDDGPRTNERRAAILAAADVLNRRVAQLIEEMKRVIPSSAEALTRGLDMGNSK